MGGGRATNGEGPKTTRRIGPRVFTKYLLLQVPGWFFAVLVLGLLVRWWGVPPWIAGALFALWVLKDLLLFPMLRVAYEPGDGSATQGLVGARAVASQPLAPRGYVRIGAELWQAELAGGQGSVSAGTAVRVRAVDGLTLVVEPEQPVE